MLKVFWKHTKYIVYILYILSEKIAHLNRQVESTAEKPFRTLSLFSLNHTLTCGEAFQAVPPEDLLLLTVIGIRDDGGHHLMMMMDQKHSETWLSTRREWRKCNMSNKRWKNTEKGEVNENGGQGRWKRMETGNKSKRRKWATDCHKWNNVTVGRLINPSCALSLTTSNAVPLSTVWLCLINISPLEKVTICNLN